MTARSISIANRHPRLRFDRRAVVRAIEILDAHHATIRVPLATFSSGELSLVFMTDRELAQLHADFLDDPTPTDVITFAGDPLLATAGEICVSADAAARQIGLQEKPKIRSRVGPRAGPAGFSAELTLYLVHGWLHLAGYDDLQPAKKRLMRRAETRAMQLLWEKDCVPKFALL